MQNIYLSPHFTLRELCESKTAEEHGIQNVPSEQEVENLRRLCQGTLEPLREGLNLPIIITSGFRNRELNDILAHYSNRSQHMAGQAADFYISPSGVSGFKCQVSGRRELLIKAFREILTNPKIDFDQLILYSTFIHVSYVSPKANRRGILKAQGNGKLGYGRLTRADALRIE